MVFWLVLSFGVAVNCRDLWLVLSFGVAVNCRDRFFFIFCFHFPIVVVTRKVWFFVFFNLDKARKVMVSFLPQL